MHNIAKIFAILLGTGFLVGCNTVEGAGEDIEAGGEAVQESSEAVQKKL